MDSYQEKKMVWIAWAIIIAFLGAILSFVGPNLVQAIALRTGNTLYIDTPTIANIVFFIASMILVVFCVLNVWGRKTIVFSIITFLSAVFLLYVSCNHYLIMTKDRIEEKPLFSLGKGNSYRWSDVESGEMKIANMKDGSGQLILTFKDGYKMEFERNEYMLDNYNAIDQLLRENGVIYEINEVGLDGEEDSNE